MCLREDFFGQIAEISLRTGHQIGVQPCQSGRFLVEARIIADVQTLSRTDAHQAEAMLKDIRVGFRSAALAGQNDMLKKTGQPIARQDSVQSMIKVR